MSHISEGDLAQLRSALEDERTTLEEQLAGHGRIQDENGDWSGSSEVPEGLESDPIDAADQIEELATNVSLVEELERKHRDVVDALAKMAAGTYGTCEASGEAIPLDRLQANPAARTRVEYAQA